MVEKRKFIRLQAPIGVVYKFVRKLKPKRSRECRLKDISGGGIRIDVLEDLRVGDLLELEIAIPQLQDPIEALGEVAWFKRHAQKGSEVREAGIRFRDIEPQALHRIFEYVYSVGIG